MFFHSLPRQPFWFLQTKPGYGLNLRVGELCGVYFLYILLRFLWIHFKVDYLLNSVYNIFEFSFLVRKPTFTYVPKYETQLKNLLLLWYILL